MGDATAREDEGTERRGRKKEGEAEGKEDYYLFDLTHPKLSTPLHHSPTRPPPLPHPPPGHQNLNPPPSHQPPPPTPQPRQIPFWQLPLRDQLNPFPVTGMLLRNT